MGLHYRRMQPKRLNFPATLLSRQAPKLKTARYEGRGGRSTVSGLEHLYLGRVLADLKTSASTHAICMQKTTGKIGEFEAVGPITDPQVLKGLSPCGFFKIFNIGCKVLQELEKDLDTKSDFSRVVPRGLDNIRVKALEEMEMGMDVDAGLLGQAFRLQKSYKSSQKCHHLLCCNQMEAISCRNAMTAKPDVYRF